MNLDQLNKLLDAGFTKADIMALGLLGQEPAADPTPAAPEEEPETAAEQQPAGLDAAAAFEALTNKMIARVDARMSEQLKQIQAANITSRGTETPDGQRSVEDIITELVLPYQPKKQEVNK